MFLVRFLNYLTAIYLKTPKGLRWIYWVLLFLYFVMPMDLMPDLIPRFGRLDDMLLVLFGLWVFDRSKHFADFYKQAYRKEKTNRERARAGASQGQKREKREQETRKTPYQVLGIPRHANSAEIKKAYKRLVSRYHPDKFAHLGPEFEETARQHTEAIIRAYEQLKS